MPRHGTWQETGTGPPGTGVLLVVIGVLVLGGGGAAAAGAVESLLVTVAAVAGGIIVVAVPAMIWLWRRGRARDEAASAEYRARVLAAEDRQRTRELESRRRHLEDQAALVAAVAAAVAGAQPRYPQPYPVRVVRGEVERLWAVGSLTTALPPRSRPGRTGKRTRTCGGKATMSGLPGCPGTLLPCRSG